MTGEIMPECATIFSLIFKALALAYGFVAPCEKYGDSSTARCAFRSE
jgi:hypothetical protein